MENNWFERLESQIKDHLSSINQLSPLVPRRFGGEESQVEYEALNTSVLSLKKQLHDKERELRYLHKDLESLESSKEQQMNLEKQLKCMRDKLSHYELEVSEKTSALSYLEKSYGLLQESFAEVSASNSELTSKLSQNQRALEDIRETTAQLQRQHSALSQDFKEAEEAKTLAQSKLKELERELKITKKECYKWEQSANEKEHIEVALEEDNEKLRAELEKAMDSLEKCQIELAFIPKIRKELLQAEELASCLSKDNENEKSTRFKLQNEKDTLEELVKQVLKATNGNDPVRHIQDLTENLRKSNSEIAIINEQLSTIEEKQTQYDNQYQNLLEDIKSFFKQIGNFFETDFLNENFPSFNATEHSFNEVLYTFYSILFRKHKELLQHFHQLNANNTENSNKASKYEEIILDLRSKQDIINSQIEKQEALFYELNTDKQKLEREIHEKTKELKLLRSYRSKTNELLGPYNELYHTEGNDTINDIISNLERTNIAYNKLNHEHLALLDKFRNLEKEHDQKTNDFNKNARKYTNRIEELTEDIEKLRNTVSKNESNTFQIIEKNSLLSNKYAELKEQNEILRHEKLRSFNICQKNIIKELFNYVIKWKSLVDQKCILRQMLAAKDEIVQNMASSYYSYIQNYPKGRPIQKLRRSVICIVFLHRISSSTKPTIIVPNLENPEHYCQVLIDENLHSLSTQNYSMINCLKNKLTNNFALREMPKQLIFMFKNQVSTIQDSHVLETNRMKQSLELALEISENEKQDISAQCSEVKEHLKKTTQHLISSAQNLKIQEEELNKYKSSCLELRESMNELQNCLKLLSCQKETADSELKRKKSQIDSMQSLIDNLKSALAKSGQGSLENEVATLTELLKKFMIGYSNLETKLEQNGIYVQGLIEELRRKNKVIKDLKDNTQSIN